MEQWRSRLALFFIIVLVIMGVDQFTKSLIIKHFSLNQSQEVIPGFFNLTYVRNTGAAFGVFAGHERWRHFFFLCIGGIALFFLFYYFLKNNKNKWVLFGTSLVFSGALGNLIDRLRFGYVIDFLDFYIGKYHWPAFNVADSAITVGTFLLIFLFIQEKN